jgi:hypothetical protein
MFLVIARKCINSKFQKIGHAFATPDKAGGNNDSKRPGDLVTAR